MIIMPIYNRSFRIKSRIISHIVHHTFIRTHLLALFNRQVAGNIKASLLSVSIILEVSRKTIISCIDGLKLLLIANYCNVEKNTISR